MEELTELSEFVEEKVLSRGKSSVYRIKDIDEPKLFRDIYPYNEVPKIPFDHVIVPLGLAQDIFITDTTFRDGQQARPPYTAEQIVDLFDLLHGLGGPNGVIRQTELFLSEVYPVCKNLTNPAWFVGKTLDPKEDIG